jgi:signal transduction histidine kinase
MMRASNRPTREQGIGRLAVIEDHDRMAHRLNAEVIHELFAVGLKLQALASQFNDVSIRTQLEDTIASTDKAIHAVRGMVFERTNLRDGSLEQVMLEAWREG